MLTVNPFATLAETVSPVYMQLFVILMVALIIVGTLMEFLQQWESLVSP